MKKPKTIVPFYFKDKSHQDMVDLLDLEYPINIKYNEGLVNRIHERYPLINKADISFIVKTIFQSFRDLLVLGNILNFHNLFFNTKLFFFDYRKNDVRLPRIKVKITTPPKLRKFK